MQGFSLVVLLLVVFAVGYVVATLKGPTINTELGRIEHKGKLYYDSTIYKVELYAKRFEDEAKAELAKVGIGKRSTPATLPTLDKSADAGSANGNSQPAPPTA